MVYVVSKKEKQMPEFDEAQAGDKKYLRKYFTALDGVLTPDKGDPLAALDAMSKHLEGAMEDTTGDEDGFGVYVRESVLPLVVATVFDREYAEKAHIEAMLEFAQSVMDHVVASVRNGTHTDAFLRSLEPMVTASQDFYTRHGIESDAMIEPEERAEYFLATGSATEFSYIDSTDAEDSIYFARVVNMLGTSGLFAAIVERISSADHPRIESSTLKLFMSLVNALEDDLTPVFLTSYLPELTQAVQVHISSLSEEEAKTQTVSDLSSALNSLSTLAKASRDESVKALVTGIQSAKLDLALKYIQLPFLAPSLRGMDYLEHLMKVASGTKAEDAEFKGTKKSGRSGGGLITYYPAAYVTPAAAAAAAARKRASGAGSSDKKKETPKIEPPTLITVPFLLSWMTEQGLITKVLKAAHPEIVKHGSHILKFIAKHDVLGNDVLDTMWDSVLTGHESLQAKLFEVFLSLIPVLPQEQVDYLYDTHIATMDPNRFDNQVLTFVSDFTLKAVAKVTHAAATQAEGAETNAASPGSSTMYGLDIFWVILTQAESDSVIREACGFLQRLLSEFPAHRKTFVSRCMANLAEGTIVSVSITLLKSIFESYTPNSLAEAIVALDEETGLVNVLIGHLGSHPEASKEDQDAVLSLLETLLTASPLELAPAQASDLWDAASAADATPAVIDWFYSLSFATTSVDPYTDERSYGALSADVKAELFTSRIASLDPAAMDAPSMRLYGAYFRDVNAKAGRLRKISDVLTRTYSYEGLEGEDFVWAVATSNPDLEVATEALFILRDLYVNADSRIPASIVAETRKGAVDRALGAVSSGSAVASRMIWFLKELVVATAVSGTPSALRIGSPSHILLTSSFDTLFDLSKDPEVMDDAWELISLLPVEPSLNQSILGSAEIPTIPYSASEDPAPFSLRALYVATLVRVGLSKPGWAEAFVGADGLKFLISVFTEPVLLDPSNPAATYGKRAASVLASAINAVFNAPGLMSTDNLASSMDASFIHNLMSQVAELAAPRPSAAISKALVLSRPKAPAGSRGTLIANCHYAATPKNLKFEINSPGTYDVAVYCVDYNTNRRAMQLVAFMGDDVKVGEPPKDGTLHDNAVVLSGPAFHNGQWVVWRVTGSGTFNIRVAVVDTGGPNWTFSALLIDPVDESVEPDLDEFPVPADPFVQVLRVDSATQGRWRGVYGSGGGVLLGKTDYPVPSTIEGYELVDYSMDKASKYEWEKRLTSDPRAMQQVDGELAGADAEPPIIQGYVEGAPEEDPAPVLPEPADTFPIPSPPEGSDEPVCIVPPELLGMKGSRGGSMSTSKSLLDMLFASVAGSPDLTDSVFSYGSGFSAWLQSTLMASRDKGVREGVRDGLAALAGSDEGVKTKLRALVVEVLDVVDVLRVPENDDNENDEDEAAGGACLTEFYDLFLRVYEGAEEAEAAPVFERLLERVQSCPIYEDDDGEVVDTALGGELRVLAALATAHAALLASASSSGFAKWLFDVALFGEPESKEELALPKAKSPQARDPAFALLVTLILAEESASDMVSKVLGTLKAGALPTGEEWNVDPENPTGTTAAADAISSSSSVRTRARASNVITKYRGLKNQGCTCYMNASLQQMFLIQELRDAILNVPLPADASEEEQSKNIMFQLQLLFAHMQESKDTYVDTIGFCKTVKMAGAFIRLGQQEDANEFLNGLVDQLEPHLAGTPQEHVFRDVFGGTYMNQIVSKECEHISERPEEYLTITTKVQGKRNLEEGLEFLIQGDMLDGDNKYHCSKCDAKVAANKRCVIQHLPNTLALHLSRFEFSFETFQNVKVNDRFEFPETLNMKPYTREGLAVAEGLPVSEDEVRPDSYYEYELAGVIIHNGSANAGHYFSYIRERDGEAADAPWYEFNDRRVTTFKKEDLDAKAFGGAYSGMSTHVKSFSGYMLFYQRKERFAARVYDSEPLPPPVAVSRDPVILAKLWKDGIMRAQRRRLLGSPSLHFMWEMVKAAPPVMETIELGVSLVFDLLCHCAGIDDMDDRIRYLQSLLLESPDTTSIPACKWLIKRLASVLCDWLRNVCVKCPIAGVREAAADMIIAVMTRVAAVEEAEAAETQEDETAAPEEEEEGEKKKVGLVEEFGTRVVKVLRLAAYRSPKTTGALVRVLKAYAESSQAARASLVGMGATKELVQLYMAWKTPVTIRSAGAAGAKDKDGSDAPPQRALVELIVYLATSREVGIELNMEDVEKVFEKGFLVGIFGIPAYGDLAQKLVTHWCLENELVTNMVLLAISSGLNMYFDRRVQDSFGTILEFLVEMEDSGMDARLQAIASGLVALLTKNLKITKGREFIISLMLNLGGRSQPLCDVLSINKALMDLIMRHGSLRNALRDEMVKPRFLVLFPVFADAIAVTAKEEGEDDGVKVAGVGGAGDDDDESLDSDEDPELAAAAAMYAAQAEE